MAYLVMAYILMAQSQVVVMAYLLMAYILMAQSQVVAPVAGGPTAFKWQFHDDSEI